MKENNKIVSLEEEDLKNISGGTKDELREIMFYLAEYEPSAFPNPDNPRELDALRWMTRNIDGFEMARLPENESNTYFMKNGKALTHEEMMVEIRKHFGLE